MARLQKISNRNVPSLETPSKRNQKKFYNYYRSGLLDEDKISDKGWKSLYEYELENGYATSGDIPRDVISKYNIDTSIGRTSMPEFEEIEPVIEQEPESKDSLFDRLSSFLGSASNKLLSERTTSTGDINNYRNFGVDVNETKYVYKPEEKLYYRQKDGI